MSQVLLAISTFPDRETASRIAEQLVAEHLAACANIGAGVQSIYWWEGKLERADETLVLFKTTRARYPEFQARLNLLHPYEVPEIVSSNVADGLPAYLEWVRKSCDSAPL